MAASHLYNELLLRIVEFADLATISTLREIPEFKTLIDRYEKSIVRHINRETAVVAPDDGASPFLLTHDINDLEGVSASELDLAREAGDLSHPAQAKPVLVRMDSFAALEELGRRDKEVEVLLNSPFFLLEHGPSGTPNSWPRLPGSGSKSRLRSLLRRAISRCDILADMEGRAVVEAGQPSLWYDYSPGVSGAANLDMCSLTEQAMGSQLQNNSEDVARRTRQLQLEYLESLSTDSLTEVYFLGTYLAESQQMRRTKPGPMDAQNFVEEHLFQEATLRHGSWTVYGEVRGWGARSLHRRQLIEQIREELMLITNEDGQSCWHLEGLRVTLHFILRERLGARDIGQLRKEVYKRVGTMIGEPTAFDNPPALEKRPTFCEMVNPWWL